MPAAREVVFDIETQTASLNDLSVMRVSVVGVYTSEDETFRIFREGDLPALWPIFERAERIIGFNSLGFDVPILQNYYAGDLMKLPHLDILDHIKRALGFRVKLDNVAQATLGVGKSGHGLEAVKWFADGAWEKLEKYCLDDVRITRDIYEFGKKNGQLFYPDLSGGVKSVAVTFTLPPAAKLASEGAKINLTLPF